MPYFIYNVYPDKKLELIESFGKYRDARDQARELRAKIAEGDTYTVKLIHAKHEKEAERLLTTEREARPIGEE
jgi:hypothetical protein